MPDIVMHHYFGREVLSELDENITENLKDYSLYDFATAGPDPFFFVSFTKGEQNKQSREFGNYMHRNYSKQFFLKLIELTKKNKDLFPYLSGFVCHYYLDVYTHPYVFYYTGVYKPEDERTHEYRGLHTKLERAMDSYIIKTYYGSKPHKFKIHKNILNLKQLDIKLKDSFDELFYEVYNHLDGYLHVNKSIRDQKKFYKLIYDPFGIMNFLLKTFDNGKSSLDLSVLSYYKKEQPNVDIFNQSHNKWINPIDSDITSNKSFHELFDEAKTESVNTIKALYENIYNGEDNNIEGYFKNLSYITGLDCKDDRELVNSENIFKLKK